MYTVRTTFFLSPKYSDTYPESPRIFPIFSAASGEHATTTSKSFRFSGTPSPQKPALG